MSESLPRESGQLKDWYAHLLIPGGDKTELTPKEQAGALDVVGIAMDGLERLIEEGRIANVELSFDILNPEQGDDTGFTFSSPDPQE